MDFVDDEADNFFGNDMFDEMEPAVADENKDAGKKTTNALDALFSEEKAGISRVKRTIPQRAKLNERTLTESNGISALKDSFQNFLPDAKKNPYDTLQVCLKKYQHWAHQIAPRVKFEDVIARCEELGNKRIVKVHMDKHRLGMSMNDEDFIKDSEEPVLDSAEMGASSTVHDVDPEPKEYSPPRGLFNSSANAKKKSPSPFRPIPADSPPEKRAPLTEEQRRRIAENRLRALEIRKRREEERRKAEEEEKRRKDSAKSPSPPPVASADQLEFNEDEIMAQFEFE